MGGQRIQFRVDRADRKRLRITVHPDCVLEVVAPQAAPIGEVIARVEKRSRWVLRQWRRFNDRLPEQSGRRHLSGEAFRYLGRQYRLKIELSDAWDVKLLAGRLVVRSPSPDEGQQVAQRVEVWFRSRAKEVVQRRLLSCLDKCPILKRVAPTKVTLRKMSRRWGSCNRSGAILINPDLICAPTHCIDYVLIHELCHLREHSHGPEFYRLLSACLPDWQIRKDRLEGQDWRR
ncbi:MAG: M48 family metallopeptidase [Lacipirellulaceae bacterium]